MEQPLNYFEENIDLYLEQFKELHNYYPGLRDQMESENLFLRGEVCFNEHFGTGFWINDCYLVEIAFSPDYPDILPFVKEIGGKIEDNYPHFLKKNKKILCLGTWTDLWLRFSKKKTILHFVHNLLIPALYVHAYWKRKGVIPPRGDRPHGTPGIIQFYSEFFNVKDLYIILRLIEFVVNYNYDSGLCPCESQKSLKECHGEMVFSLKSIPQKYLIMEYTKMCEDYFKYFRKSIK